MFDGKCPELREFCVISLGFILDTSNYFLHA